MRLNTTPLSPERLRTCVVSVGRGYSASRLPMSESCQVAGCGGCSHGVWSVSLWFGRHWAGRAYPWRPPSENATTQKGTRYNVTHTSHSRRRENVHVKNPTIFHVDLLSFHSSWSLQVSITSRQRRRWRWRHTDSRDASRGTGILQRSHYSTKTGPTCLSCEGPRLCLNLACRSHSSLST